MLLSMYSYYKVLAIFPVLASLFVPPSPLPPCFPSPLPPLVTISLISVSMSLLLVHYNH